MRASMHRIVAPAALLAIACSPSVPVYACPELNVDGYRWIGAVGPPGTVPAFAAVTLELDGEVLDVVAAARDGSFALRGGHDGAFPHGARPEVHAGRRTIARLDPGPSSAFITYAPGARPVVQDAPRVRFTGELAAATPRAVPIREAFIVNWNGGTAQPVSARIDETFSAETNGEVGDCITVISLHDDGTTGGCWWPRGGGCICHHCSLADETAGTCVEPSRATEHDCTPVPGMAWPDAAMPAETPPAAWPDVARPDVAWPDAGPPDASGRTPLPASERHDPPPSPSHRTPPSPDRADDIPTGQAPDAGTSPPATGAHDAGSGFPS